jgi:hypothetical protein
LEFKAGFLTAQRKKLNPAYCRLDQCTFEPKPNITERPFNGGIKYPEINAFYGTNQSLSIPFKVPDQRTKFKIICTGLLVGDYSKKVELNYQSSRTNKISIF